MTLALPIDPELPGIVSATLGPTGCVVVAPPGTGKSTRVPPAVMEVCQGQVLVLQPRRLAARMLASRVATDRGSAVGDEVGYEVRFDSKSTRETRLVYMTSGVFLRRVASDPALTGVSAVVIDEFHERSIENDLALALVHALRQRRHALGLAVMSATLDPAPVATYLGGAAVVTVAVSTHAVDYRYRPGDRSWKLHQRVAAGVRELGTETSGNVLVFLPGRAEIERAFDAVSAPARAAGMEVARLHGSLPADEQDRALQSTRRRVILATNVAETSLTIDDVSGVVDSGLVRVARHSPWTGLSRLAIEPVSQASAEQRAGRAGRTRAGVCIRLYERGDFLARPAFTDPEIARADLSAALLTLAGLGIAELPWYQSPPPAAESAARELLSRLGLITDSGAITERGRCALALPTHPRLARIAIAGEELGVGESACAAAAAIDAGPLWSGEAPMTSDSDIVLEADWLGRAQPPRGASTRAHREGRRIARQLERALSRSRKRSPRPRGAPSDPDERDRALRQAVASGFADRLARRRRSGRPALIVPGVSRAALSSSSCVRDAELMVCVDATLLGAAGGQRLEVRRASAVDIEQLIEIDADHFRDEVSHEIDDSGRVVRVSRLLWDGVVVDETRSADGVSDHDAARVLLAELEPPRWRVCADADRVLLLQRRLRLLGHEDELSAAVLDALLQEACAGARRRAELCAVVLEPLARYALSAERRDQLEREAPLAVSLPGRKRVPIHYEEDRPPWIESRLQDFFGLEQLPQVAGEPVVAHLLAPNRRAVQVTRDLPSFWSEHYPALRKQLSRRYPKHAWPDDPRRPA